MVDCITFYPGTKEWLPYLVLAMFGFGILHEIYFAIFAIFNFYLRHNIPEVLKSGSIAVTLLIVLSQMFLVVIWISEYKCNSFLYFTFGPIFVVLYASCYVLLFTMFAIKVHASTKDSIYRLSKCFISYLTILSLTFIVAVISLIYFFATKNTTWEYFAILFGMILNWVLYVSLLVKLIKALYYVVKTSLILSVHVSYDQSKHASTCPYTFDEDRQNSNVNVTTNIKTASNDSTSNINKSNHNNSSCIRNNGINNINNINNSRAVLFGALFAKCGVAKIKQTMHMVTDRNFVIGGGQQNRTLGLSVADRGSSDNQNCGQGIIDVNLNRSMIKALGIGKIIIRLIIVISVVWMSGIIILITSYIPFIETQDKSSVGLRMNLMYLCYMIDLKINNVCLLYQYGFCQKMFDNNCRLCTICLKHIVICAFRIKLTPDQARHS